MENFGQILKKLRTQQGMYQVELAEEVGVSRSLVFSWEKGNCEPSIENLIKLCEIFGVDPNYLLGFDSQKPAAPLTAPEERLLALIKTLPKTLQHQLLGYAEALVSY